jgi:hypothetical protein
VEWVQQTEWGNRVANNIRIIDMGFLDDLFRMGGGYVLDFSNRTFAHFFADDLNIDIDDPLYARDGTSKARRLRCFLQTVDKPTVVKVLRALWDYRRDYLQRHQESEWVANATGRFLELIARLEGRNAPQDSGMPPVQAFDRSKFIELKNQLLAFVNVDPHLRGYEFEKFLKRLFDFHKLAAREPFRLRGEQIDGSFLLASEVYLVEAKWQAAPVGVGELHAFHGKVEQKAAWTRGLFVSHSGFSEDGLNAFGRGRKVICMDGLDLYDALDRGIPIDHVLEQKVRKAAETGLAFVRVRDLYP